MIHVFSYRDKNYIYDVGSGSLHECDTPTADYLKAKEEGQAVDITYITDDQIAEILGDVNALKEQGLLFKEEVKSYPMKSNEVKALCIHICHDCNFRCRYCFADEGAYHSKRESMSFDTAKKAVDFLIANSGKRKVLEMDFFGGEPLMNLDVLKQTVYYAKEEGAKVGKKFLFTTTTNALLLNDDTIRFFNEEMENVVLSLDGRKEVHDAIRKSVNGKGTYDLIIDKIKKFISLRGDKSYYVRGTFTAKNLDFGKDVLFIADQGVDSISMEPVVTEIPDLQIREEHLPTIEKEYENLCEDYLKRYAEGKGFNFFHFNIDLEGGPCLSKRVSACGAGNEYFSVTPNGDLYPCHQFAGDENFRMGSVFEGITRPDIREKFKNSCLFTRKKCENCFAKFICSGGCSANNYHFNGDIDEPYETTCAMMKKRVECAMHILAQKKLLKENG
ncbi:MAG: thioether cross-link-forming SCIFF peptide maturase [Clostridiales bacterium]|nr:thioether cross-link-forming SCIFF peptide maturase [Clostridiales bacterium]